MSLDSTWNKLQDKMIALAEEERGDAGGASLTQLLMTVGGVAAAATVVTGIGVAIAAALGKI